MPTFATGCVFNASRSLSKDVDPCASHSRVKSSSARGLPLPAWRMRATGTSASRPSACVVTAATRRSAASGARGSRSSGCSAWIVASVARALGPVVVRSSFEGAVRITSSRVCGSFRATMWRIAALALSAAWISSTTSTSGLSSVAASTALRNESARRNGTTSAVHSTGFGTPGNTLKISGDTRDSSLNASGSAAPMARCSVSCLTSSASTANGSSRSASYACARATTAHLEPHIVQLRELLLAADQRLRLEAALVPLGDPARLGRPRRCAPALPQQARDPRQVGTGLRAKLLRQAGLEAAVHLERVAAVAHPRARLHQPTHGVLRQGIEVEQDLRVALDRGEIADAATGVHLPHQTIPDSGHELGAPLVLPLLEGDRTGDLEAVQEGAADLRLARLEPPDIRVHGVVGKGDGRPLHLQVLAAHLLLHDRERLRQRVPRPIRRRVGPQQVHQVVAGELLPRLGCEADQEGEMLAGAEPDLLASFGKEEGSTQGKELQVGRHRRLTAFRIGTIRQANQPAVNTLNGGRLPLLWRADRRDRQRRGRRQIGHGPIFGSTPRISRTGPSCAVVSAVVSVTVMLNIITRPLTDPWKRAGRDGPT